MAVFSFKFCTSGQNFQTRKRFCNSSEFGGNNWPLPQPRCCCPSSWTFDFLSPRLSSSMSSLHLQQNFRVKNQPKHVFITVALWELLSTAIRSLWLQLMVEENCTKCRKNGFVYTWCCCYYC